MADFRNLDFSNEVFASAHNLIRFPVPEGCVYRKEALHERIVIVPKGYRPEAPPMKAPVAATITLLGKATLEPFSPKTMADYQQLAVEAGLFVDKSKYTGEFCSSSAAGLLFQCGRDKDLEWNKATALLVNDQYCYAVNLIWRHPGESAIDVAEEFETIAGNWLKSIQFAEKEEDHYE